MEFDDDSIGCQFPEKCVFPGRHLISECKTAEQWRELEQWVTRERQRLSKPSVSPEQEKP